MRNRYSGSIGAASVIICCFTGLYEGLAAATDTLPPPKIEAANVAGHSDLMDATSVAISPDGRFIYTASWARGNVVIFDRATRTGTPIYFETITGPALNGGASFRLTPSGRLGVTAAFNDRAVTLFRRDEDSGSLTIVDTVRHGERGADNLEFAVETTISNDSKFVYVGGLNAVTVFRIANEGKLEWVQTFQHLAIQGVRSLAVSPDDKFMYIASATAGAVVTLERELDSGRLKVAQVVQDNFSVDGGLPGVFSIAVSPDGKNLYTSSGRFGGSNAVCAFKRANDGNIEVIQKFIQAVDLKDFAGGNEIAVSPDGRIVAALASISDKLVYFERDPSTGMLELIEALSVGSNKTPGCAGIAFSPDGKNCYVADERSGELVTFAVR